MSAVAIALILAISAVAGSIAAPLLIARQQFKRQDAVAAAKKEQDELVAAEAIRQQTEVAAEAKRQQDEVAARQAEAAEAVRAVASELRAAAVGEDQQSKNTVPAGISVVITHLNGQRQNAYLLSIPHVGDNIRLINGVSSPAYRVLDVTYMESNIEPSVLIAVQPVDVENDNIGIPSH